MVTAISFCPRTRSPVDALPPACRSPFSPWPFFLLLAVSFDENEPLMGKKIPRWRGCSSTRHTRSACYESLVGRLSGRGDHDRLPYYDHFCRLPSGTPELMPTPNKRTFDLGVLSQGQLGYICPRRLVSRPSDGHLRDRRQGEDDRWRPLRARFWPVSN